MIKSTADEKYDFIIENIAKSLEVNGQSLLVDIKKVDDVTYHVISKGKAFKLNILDVDLKSKSMLVQVNGNSYHLDYKDHNDLLLEKLGLTSTEVQKEIELKAPMPGLIVEVKVSQGQLIKKGEPLAVLKAMKMENVLVAAHDCKIERILVEENQKVEKDEVIIQF